MVIPNCNCFHVSRKTVDEAKPKLSKVDSVYLLKPELRQSYCSLPLEARPTAPVLEMNILYSLHKLKEVLKND